MSDDKPPDVVNGSGKEPVYSSFDKLAEKKIKEEVYYLFNRYVNNYPFPEIHGEMKKLYRGTRGKWKRDDTEELVNYFRKSPISKAGYVSTVMEDTDSKVLYRLIRDIINQSKEEIMDNAIENLKHNAGQRNIFNKQSD